MAGSRTLFIYEVDMEEYRGYTINLVLGKSVICKKWLVSDYQPLFLCAKIGC